jgi:ABC-type spermidine/putrescine transport system permease subunit I
LIDIQKCSLIFNRVLNAKTIQEAKNEIKENFVCFSFICTLDSICTILLMRLGYYSELFDVKIMCQSITIAVISNYLSFIMVYPAALSLIYEVSF